MMSDITVPARDGVTLVGTCLEPGYAGNGAVVLFCPALGVRRQIYADFAAYLAVRGFVCVLFDYRGTGDSLEGSVRRSRATMQEWGEQDVPAMLDWIQGRYPGCGIHVIAHSAGGQVFGLAHNNHLVRSLVCIASGSGYWGHWRGVRKLKLWLLWHLGPVLTRMVGYFPGHWFGMSPLPPGVALQWARWGRNPHYISDVDGAPIRRHFHGYRGRAVFYSFSDDPLFAPSSAVSALAGYYANADVSIKHIRPADYGMTRIGHFGFFRDSMSPTAWDACAAWLLQ